MDRQRFELDTLGPELTPEQVRSASLYACEQAASATEARDFLEALGLHPLRIRVIESALAK